MADIVSFPPQGRPRIVEPVDCGRDQLVLQQIAAATSNLATAQNDLADTVAFLVAGNVLAEGRPPVCRETLICLCDAIIHCSTALGVPANMRDLRRAALAFTQVNGDA